MLHAILKYHSFCCKSRMGRKALGFGMYSRWFGIKGLAGRPKILSTSFSLVLLSSLLNKDLKLHICTMPKQLPSSQIPREERLELRACISCYLIKVEFKSVLK